MFTMREINKIAAADISLLPVLYVYMPGYWRGDAIVDSRNRVHMSAAQFEELKKNLPTEFVSRRNEYITEYKIAIEKHHIGAGDTRGIKPVKTKKEYREFVDDFTGVHKDDLN